MTAVQSADAWVELLKTMGDPVRLRMVRLMEQQGTHGLSVGELAEILKLPQSTVSRHLKVLMETGLADVRREATSMLYRLADTANSDGIKQLRTMSRQRLDDDPQAQTDAQRMAVVLQQRDADSEKFFGKAAGLWDQIREEWFGSTFHLEALLAFLDPTWTVLDIGTGTGALLPLLAPHVKKVVGVDPSAAMLKAAQARVKDLRLGSVELKSAPAERLPLGDKSVDAALLALVLHHVADPVAAFKEARRVLKPRGVLVIVDLQPHTLELFRDKMHHRWMGFEQAQMYKWLAAAGLGRFRWHPLPAKQGRVAKDVKAKVTVPDLFVMRAEAPGETK